MKLISDIWREKISHFEFLAIQYKSELKAAILILLLSFSVFFFFEDRVIDPWGILNPQKFGILLLVLSGLELSGYIFAKLFGERNAFLIVGFFGGFVSSTAVLVSAAHSARISNSDSRHLVASVLASKMAALLELILILMIVSKSLALKLLIPIGSCFVTGALCLWLLAKHSSSKKSKINLRSPLHVGALLKLALLMTGLLGAVASVQHWLGTQATKAVSFATGLFELHGLSFATATMFEHGQIDQVSAIEAILLAVLASLIAKIAISWALTSRAFASQLTLIFSMMAATMIVAFFIFS